MLDNQFDYVTFLVLLPLVEFCYVVQRTAIKSRNPCVPRNVELPARIPYQVENQCPSSPTLLEAQQHVLADIKASFQEFYKV